MISTVLEGATIIDGSGRPGVKTDIAFAGERVARIGDCSDREARRRLDCRSKVVAPGFIDACSHTGERWLTHDSAQAKTGQGIVGEITTFPSDSSVKPWEESLSNVEIMDLTRRRKNGTYAVFLVTSDARASAEAGSAGVFVDLKTTTVDEAVALARESALGGAPRAAVALRNDADDIVEAIDDAIEIAQRGGVAVHIRNHHVAYPRERASMERSLERIDRARSRGTAITCDMTPYIATWIQLTTLLPRGITRDALHDDALAAAVAMQMQARLGDRWHDLVLAQVGSEERMAWCGIRFDEIARQTRKSPARAVLDYIRDEGDAAYALHFCLREDDLAMLLSADFCAIGTSAPDYRIDERPFGLIHPRTFGSFARIYGRFVRQRRSIGLEEAVRRMTSLPAHIFGLRGRGTLEPGAPADVMVFDEQRFADTATYEQPFSLPVGLTHLFRDGVELNVVGGVS